MLQIQPLDISCVSTPDNSRPHDVMRSATIANVTNVNAYATYNDVARVSVCRNTSDYGTTKVEIRVDSTERYGDGRLALDISLEDAKALVQQLQEVIDAPYVWRSYVGKQAVAEVPFTPEGKVDFEMLAENVKDIIAPEPTPFAIAAAEMV